MNARAANMWISRHTQLPDFSVLLALRVALVGAAQAAVRVAVQVQVDPGAADRQEVVAADRVGDYRFLGDDFFTAESGFHIL